MLAEELFYRAGGLVKVYPILDEPLMLHSNVDGGDASNHRLITQYRREIPML